MENERQYIENHYAMMKDVIMNAVANDGLGVYYDAYALCEKRENIQIPKEIPIYLWNGTNDTTTPVSFAGYFEQKYEVNEKHIIKEITESK